MTYTIAAGTVKNSHDRQRNCPKHVEFYFKNKFQKLVHLFGFIIRIYDDARSPEYQTQFPYHCTMHETTLLQSSMQIYLYMTMNRHTEHLTSWTNEHRHSHFADHYTL